MSSRNYNKLYVNADREEGSEKILVGYQSEEREVILVKDKETSFHIPYYADPVKIADSSLIRDGATAGPFPAASDRIFKNRKGYGNVTSNGTPSDIPDGVWFCSWLYKNEFGIVQWMDRYYNPGAYTATLADGQLTEVSIYRKQDPVFRDVPSTMVLESGVHYRYFHIGENTAESLITTFRGASSEHVKLDLKNWGTSNIDTSPNSIPVKIVTGGPHSQLYPTLNVSDRVTAPVISFDNYYDISVSMDHEPIYALNNEFTWSFWAYSNDWNQSQSTQLMGNFSSVGGVGIFLDTLSSYPFFVIPETYYGHLLYLNESYTQYKDVPLFSAIKPQMIAFDSNNHVIICYLEINTLKLIRLDNTGKVLTKFEDNSHYNEKLIQLLCGPNDNIIVITDTTRYTYNTNFELVNKLIWKSSNLTVAAYAVLNNGTAELISTDNVYDSKFIGTTQFVLTATDSLTSDGDVWVKYAGDTEYSLYAEFDIGDIATVLAVDPQDRLWVLHANNKIAVYDSSYEAMSDPILNFPVGPNVTYAQKHISFICAYDRSTGSREWRALIYYTEIPDSGNTPQLYVVNMEGKVIQIVNILSLFNNELFNTLGQTQQGVRFASKGDFTGYEQKRIFNKTLPYNNSSQLVLKASLRDVTKNELQYVQIKTLTSIKNWNQKSWQHVLLTLRNRTFTLYVNETKVATLDYPSKYELSYELRPPMFIGTPVGSRFGLNQEIGWTSAIFNGLIESVKIYDYSIDESKLEMFQRAVVPAQNIYWSLPTPSIQYIEKIERMFKNKIPGSKSTFFNIKLKGTQITDPQTRIIIEQEIRNKVSELKPMYTEFLNVTWVE